MPLLPDPDSTLPLDASEFERLQALLDAGAARGYMNVEMLDGYFAALICAPRQASTGLRFGPVFGVEVLAEAELADAAAVEALLWRHWRTLVATLEIALEDPSVQYQPLLYEDASGAVAGNDWVRGFLRGAADDPAAWRGFEAAVPRALDPVRRLAEEPVQGPRYAADERAALLAAVAAMLVTAYRHFEAERG
ncbi:MAG TPA: UPF0149 family protein [Gammaproteobacteria bacterium]|nr:UPF0149 family protein [Gammaproteobacteria bacterium]